uniref:Secreted protein n=1 Tax=Amblyomma triste TaxID=251400 RepID=A0A023GA01_AMBTT
MSFMLALCFCAIASAAATRLTPLDITPMVDVSERLAVVKRTYYTETPFRCHTANKLYEISVNKYRYNLKARKTTLEGYEFTSGDVDVSLENIPASQTKRSTYTSGYTKTTLTLVHMSEDKNCFVVKVDKNSTFTGCELIVPASQVRSINPACKTFFDTNCNGKAVELYQADCTYD